MSINEIMSIRQELSLDSKRLRELDESINKSLDLLVNIGTEEIFDIKEAKHLENLDYVKFYEKPSKNRKIINIVRRDHLETFYYELTEKGEHVREAANTSIKDKIYNVRHLNSNGYYICSKYIENYKALKKTRFWRKMLPTIGILHTATMLYFEFDGVTNYFDKVSSIVYPLGLFFGVSFTVLYYSDINTRISVNKISMRNRQEELSLNQLLYNTAKKNLYEKINEIDESLVPLEN